MGWNLARKDRIGLTNATSYNPAIRIIACACHMVFMVLPIPTTPYPYPHCRMVFMVTKNKLANTHLKLKYVFDITNLFQS